MVKNPDFKKAGIRIGTLIGDEDSSTIAAVQRETSHRVVKWSNSNHVRKKFIGKLYKLANTHRELDRGSVIPYLKRCFNYALDQNKEYTEATTKALLSIAEHIFGSYSNCGTWCEAKDNPEYVFKSLPKGKPLFSKSLQTALHGVLMEFTSRVLKVAPGGSSQLNESFNHMVATRALKSRHYASSRSILLQVAAAVCQKNFGPKHIIDVRVEAGLPPGTIAEEYRLRREVLQRAIAVKPEKTGLSVVGGELHHYNKVVTTIPPREVGEKFIRFLGECGPQVLLLGHNIVRFDAPRIIRWLQGLGLLESFVKGVYGVCDTIPLIGQGKVKKQEELAKLYLKGEEWERIIAGSHNALTDCQILYGLLAHFKVSDTAITAGALRLQTLLQRQAIAKKKAQFLETLQCLRDHISKNMISKIAAAGINMNSLRDAFN
ncbi:uncharacterized protein LOC143903538 [Temnothorax americanus]|uniref:uncharacterized protein LOC143903538 n=1 Tax=Temnothorax americanus TaxID=1964332 RepID=UPI004068B4A6